MGFCEDFGKKLSNVETPECRNRNWEIVLGLFNIFFLFGIGTIIAGAMGDFDAADVFIGLLQLFLPVVGWIWSIIWGLLMIFRGHK